MISILIPCRNEERYIVGCIKSIQNFIIPEDRETEILVIDGMSTDNTRFLINRLIKDDSRIRMLDNPRFFQVSALNIGIKESSGSFILRLDAHAVYPENYIEKLYTTWDEIKADCVGGVIETLPGADTFQAAIVQAITTHSFGVGNSSFRTGNSHGYKDTVPYGLFPKEVFQKYGYYNENLISGEDYEMSSRIRLHGGKIWQNGDVVVQYFNQPALYKFYQKQFVREGHYNVYMWYLAPYTFALRHAFPGVFAAGIIGGLILSFFSNIFLYIYLSVLLLYGLLAVLSSVQQAVRYRKLLFIPVLPLCFFGFHFLYGFGIISGIFKIMLGLAPVKK